MHKYASKLFGSKQKIADHLSPLTVRNTLLHVTHVTNLICAWIFLLAMAVVVKDSEAAKQFSVPCRVVKRAERKANMKISMPFFSLKPRYCINLVNSKILLLQCCTIVTLH